MDITKLTDQDLAYIEGFVQKCAEHGVDPEQLLEKHCACMGKKKGKGKAPAFGGKAAPKFAKKSEAQAQGKGNVKAEKLAAAVRKLAEDDENKDEKKDGRVAKAVKGTAAGAVAGGALAGVAGGAAGAMALNKARSAPGLAGMAVRAQGKDKLTAYLRAIAKGARAMAPAGAAAGGFMGGVTGASA